MNTPYTPLTQIDAALAALEEISEPFIARSLARRLPPGHGLFIGNSMPIRDMDMYAPPAPPAVAAGGAAGAVAGAAAAAAAAAPGSVAPGGGGGGGARAGGAAPAAAPAAGTGAAALVGVPVAANRGASGIDGVLSTAAGEHWPLGPVACGEQAGRTTP